MPNRAQQKLVFQGVFEEAAREGAGLRRIGECRIERENRAALRADCARSRDPRAARSAARKSDALRRFSLSTSALLNRSSVASAARHASGLPVYECECRKPRVMSSS